MISPILPPLEINLTTNDLIRRGMISWLKADGSSFCYTPISAPTLAPPEQLVWGMMIHPDDFDEVMTAITRGDFG